MWRLEAKGHESDVKKRECCLIPIFVLKIISSPATGSNIMFVRGDEQSKAVQEMQSAENPDEIDISEDEDEDEEEEGGEDGKYLKSVQAFFIVYYFRRAAQEEREGGGGGDGCAGQGVWRTQETQCGVVEI